MTVLAPDTALLPAAPALRAAIAQSLWALTPADAYLGHVLQASGAALTDDLCCYATLAERHAVPDAALARAAAEDSQAVSVVARLLYGARLLLRSAGFAHAQKLSAPVDASKEGATSAPQFVATIKAAFDVLIDVGAANVLGPRRLIEGMRGANASAETGMLSRLLTAAYADDPRGLGRALAGPPYCIDPAHLRLALAQTHVTPSMSARSALAAAISALPGATAKEAALAALAAFDAARPVGAVEHTTIGSAVTALAEAVGAHARHAAIDFTDSDVPAMLQAAASADRVWASVQDAPPLGHRIATLLDGLTQLRAPGGMRLVADDGSQDAPDAIVEFDDSARVPIGWESLASALDISHAQPDTQRKRDALHVVVSAPLARSLAAYLMEDENATSNRVVSGIQHLWPQPEAPVAWPAPAMTFSASRLNAYVKCPRRWFYDYLCEVLDDPSSLHASYGRAVHDALEALHRYVRVPSRHAPALILERLLRELDIAFGRARLDFSSQLEYEVSRMRARRMADQYVRWLVAESSRAPIEIMHVELLQRQRFGAHDFVGYIDRIDRPLDGGPVTIYDYKTGRIDTDAATYLAKVRRGDEAQLALYYAMRRAAGDVIARIALVSIRDPRDDAWILALDIVDNDGRQVVDAQARDGVLRTSCSRSDLEASLAALVERCDFLTTQGMAHYPPGDDPPCNFCAYRRACRERPPDGERIFAR